MIIFNLLFYVFFTFAGNFTNLDSKIYKLNKHLKTALSFNVKPSELDKSIQFLLYIKKLNLYFKCIIGSENNLSIELIGLEGFDEIKKGLEKSLRIKLNQIDLTNIYKQLFKSKFVKLINSDFNYKSEYNPSVPVLVKLKIDNMVKKVKIYSGVNITEFSYKYKMFSNEYQLSEIILNQSEDSKQKIKEINTIKYKTMNNLSVIDYVDVKKSLNNKITSKSKIKFYNYKLK